MTRSLSPYLYRVFLQISCLLNVILGGRNHQTFSSRNYIWKEQQRWNMVWFLDGILGRDHCLICHVNCLLLHQVLIEKGHDL